MGLEWHDAVGALGGVLILYAYLLLQLGRLRVEGLAYSLLNWAGGALVLFSLSHEFNLAAALLEFTWMMISSAGIVGWFMRRRNSLGESIDEEIATS